MSAQDTGNSSGEKVGTVTKCGFSTKSVKVGNFVQDTKSLELSIDFRLTDTSTGRIVLSDFVNTKIDKVHTGGTSYTTESKSENLISDAMRYASLQAGFLVANAIVPMKIEAVGSNGKNIKINYGSGFLEPKDIYRILPEITVPKGFSYIHEGWDRIMKKDSEGRTYEFAPKAAYVPAETVVPQLRAALRDTFVGYQRFAVMERSVDELNKIRQEQLETSGTLNANMQLDFMLSGEMVEYSTRRVENTGLFSSFGGESTSNIHKISLSITFTDVHSGQIVLSETISKEIKGAKVTTQECCSALADDLAAKITEQLYPPMFFSVSGDGIIQIPNSNYSEGSVVEVYIKGEPLIDPYSQQVIGYEETEIGSIIVFEINKSIAKACISPDSAGAKIEKGMMCRNKNKIDKKKLKLIKKALGKK